MTPDEIASAREHYDNADTSESIAGGTWETDVQDDPFVSVTVRFRKTDLDRLRGDAADRGLSVFGLIVERATADL